MADLERIISRLEERGHRLTPARLAILATVASRKRYFTVDDISRMLPQVGRATVFRTMKLLTEMDVVCRVLLEDGSLRYQMSRRGHHHHLVCTRCGAVQDFTDCDVSSLVDQLARQTDYEIEGHWLEVYGRCGKCRAGTGAPAEAAGAAAP
ncbi:MAG TPA: Fur family transcriptional regulator [Dehalococcoidia bacterium]